ncbi:MULTISPECIES: helix-turn-helix domain-containing protein [Lysobacter]|uniref:Helix-turn-helix domain-containing protein n=1 Tax=Lysobacter firmicutimachus TaxID=1792846 RepID=A0ABU8D620_9GAMM|nr:helix-turn-helix domain-containing protein [Lysobacter antibioticus]
MSPGAAYRTCHARGASLATHRHRHAYAALVLDGDYTESSVDGPLPCTPGTLVLHPAYHAHGDRFGGLGAQAINLDLPERGWLDAGPSDNRAFGQAPARVRSSETGRSGMGGPDAVLAAFGASAWRVHHLGEALEVFARCPQRLPELLACAVPQAPSPLPDWQGELLRRMADSEDEIGVLAGRLGVSAEHASRALTRSYGMSPRALRRELRWRRALRLLATDLPLAEVAAAAGFADQSHLHRIVVAHAGCTPATLRRQIKYVQDPAPAQAA